MLNFDGFKKKIREVQGEEREKEKYKKKFPKRKYYTEKNNKN